MMAPTETISSMTAGLASPQLLDSPWNGRRGTLTSSNGTLPPHGSLNSALPQPPANTFVSSQQQAQQQQAVQDYLSGVFGHYMSCIWPWRRASAAKTDFDRYQEEREENFEIALESIDVDFKENYIGGGNQSSVFRGMWEGRYIALKKLNRASEVDIAKLVALDHPNVIRTLGISSKEIYPCIVMEYCEKGGLFDVLRRADVDKLLFMRWAKGIAAGMQYLHSLKIVHRDLKSPNILVDRNDCVKICDFGSLYTFDKTYMPSVVMSVCGTSQWMSPEMMKNEPCNEKVDVWSFGVVLWELLSQEVPYRNITPMAIMYGVGSDRLRLHVPKSAPDCFKLVLKLCFAKRPRNRPSFTSLLSHLENLRVEMEPISADAWRMRKDVWKREIGEETDRLRQHSNNADAEAQKAEELQQKRMHELRHAQELQQLFRAKLQRVDEMIKDIAVAQQEIHWQRIELAERERRLAEEEMRSRSGYSIATTSTTASPSGCFGHFVQKPPEVKSVKLHTRPSTMRTSMRSNRTYTDVCQMPGKHAVLTMQVDGSDEESGGKSMEEEEEEEADGALARGARRDAARARAGAVAQRQASLEWCASCAHFRRNSTIRTSGNSCDSGFYSNLPAEEEAATAAAACDGDPHRGAYWPAADLYRNQQARWSDTWLHPAARRARRAAATAAFARDSPARVPHARRARPARAHQSTGCLYAETAAAAAGVSPEADADVDGVPPAAPVVVDESGAVVGRQRRRRRRADANANEDADGEEEPDEEEEEEEEEEVGRRAADDDATLADDEENGVLKPAAKRPEAGDEGGGRSPKRQATAPLPRRGPNNNNNTVNLESVTNRSVLLNNMNNNNNGVALLMDNSTSTMASSIERSLEMGAHAPDGLSDKERHVKAVTRTYQRHRRCASNPVCLHEIMAKQCESTESDESVHC